MEKKRSVGIITVLLSLFFLSSVSAETVILKSGQKIEGEIVERTAEYVKVRVSGMTIAYPVAQIESIEERTIERTIASPSSSEKMFKKFESISNERCLTFFTKITKGTYFIEEEQELIAYSESARQDILEMHKETIREMQKWINEINGKTLQEKAEKLTSEIMKQWKDAFIVSDIDADKLLSGQYDDAKNLNDIRQCYNAFAEIGIYMSPILRFCMHDINDFRAGKVNSSAELEFIARLLKEHLKQVKKQYELQGKSIDKILSSPAPK